MNTIECIAVCSEKTNKLYVFRVWKEENGTWSASCSCSQPNGWLNTCGKDPNELFEMLDDCVTAWES